MSTIREAGATRLLLAGIICATALGCEPVQAPLEDRDASVTTTAPPATAENPGGTSTPQVPTTTQLPATTTTAQAATTTTSTTSTTTAPQPMNVFQIDRSYVGSGGPRVAIIGDSLTVAGRPDLMSALSGYQVKIASVVGEGIGGGPWSRNWAHDVLGKATREYLTAPDAPDVLVIALGTNNAWQPELTPEQFEAAWPAMVSEYRGSCLVAVTATESSKPVAYDAAEAAWINAAVMARADRVVDWHARDLTGMLQSDHIHLLPAGARYRARLIADAIASCDLSSVTPDAEGA